MPTTSCRWSCFLFAIYLLVNDRSLVNVVVLSAPQRSYRTSGRVAPYGRPEFANTGNTSYMMGPPKITTRCSCGGASIQFPNHYSPLTAQAQEPNVSIVDCHCPSCRRFHVTSFVRYLEIPENDVQVQGDTVVRFKDSCLQAGTVMRTYCRRCFSKLLTTPINNSGYGNNKALVNMGPIDEESVPEDLAQQWKTSIITNWRSDKAPAWTFGVPHYVLENPNSKQTKRRFDEILSPVTVTGGCTCGTCQYKFRLSRRTEFQHCYCSLCRQLSGGPFMTWVPVLTKKDDFGWYIAGSVTKINWSTPQRASAPEQGRPSSISSDCVPLVRYTNHGQRHVCAQCGGVLSIVYDNDNFDDEKKGTTIWLAAGSFDSIRFPSSHVERYLERVVHICCRYSPKWYNIPNDGMQRIDEAS